jgi:hypothetical protein
MRFSDLALSRRLERAEGRARAQFAEARRRLFPDSGSEWMECSGAYAVFDGIGSPVTQTFGLGIFEELTAASLDVIERFFLDRGAQVDHEVSPLVDCRKMPGLFWHRRRASDRDPEVGRKLRRTTAGYDPQEENRFD